MSVSLYIWWNCLCLSSSYSFTMLPLSNDSEWTECLHGLERVFVTADGPGVFL
jgi:hypothetical protein